ncbi:kinesin heavy chain, partial [Histoplasma capsulatum]
RAGRAAPTPSRLLPDSGPRTKSNLPVEGSPLLSSKVMTHARSIQKRPRGPSRSTVFLEWTPNNRTSLISPSAPPSTTS